ncbi:peptide deformylase [Postechiella marina]|uniref:Peptide deformylase n=1 Tax=Postechiella marina TaxID=943941 RepID=A0ABP8BZU3_9FLAO
MNTKLDISYLGHEILRKKASHMSNVLDKNFQQLIDNMLFTVKQVNGLGIAAPQVYQSKRMFIIASKPSKRYPNAPEMAPIAIINPVILNHSEEKIKDWEGCLSIPGIRGLVPRYKSIDVAFTDRTGKQITQTFNDFVARIFQHELDHLNGIVFLDQLDSNKDIITEKEYQKIVSNL